jgi:hypothetical protein
VTFVVALEDLTATLVDLAREDDIMPTPSFGGVASPFTLVSVVSFSYGDSGGVRPPGELFIPQLFAPPFGPLEVAVADEILAARAFVIPSAGGLNGTTIGIEGTVALTGRGATPRSGSKSG